MNLSDKEKYEYKVLRSVVQEEYIVCRHCSHEMNFMIGVTVNDMYEANGVEFDCEDCGGELLYKNGEEIREMVKIWKVGPLIEDARNMLGNIMTDNEIDELEEILDQLEIAAKVESR